MAIAIRIENLSKQYRLGLVSTRTISHDLNRWWQVSIRGKDDPYLKIGDINDRTKTGESEYVWALRNINIEVQKGEVLGIIGKNGAGKSTLLKILSKVTAPTTGSVKVRGRIASLLEVGTGFHNEMTGRENIFMNGSIMGMTKAEIKRKFDEIVNFAGVERYIDTPVKRYSSGMTVRLGFAVAAHLEPEILIVDEVLAVGDAEFQKKAIGKMQEVSKNEGRTVLFVSHNMAAIQNLSMHGLLLSNGSVAFKGGTMECIENYLISNNDHNIVPLSLRTDRKGEGAIKLDDVTIGWDTSHRLKSGSDALILLKFANSLKIHTNSYRIYINIKNKLGDVITHLSTDYSKDKFLLTPEIKGLKFIISKLNLAPGYYNMRIFIEVNHQIEDWIDNACSFEIVESDIFQTGIGMLKGYGDFYFDYIVDRLI